MFKKTGKLDYRIKLLSGNNVVLVEANGFESEIFMPEILNGRISFQNIIPNRRCCYINNSCCNTKTIGTNCSRLKKRRGLTSDEQQPEESSDKAFLTMSNSTKVWRLNAGNDSRISPPIARSTPAPAPSPVTSDVYHHTRNKENFTPRSRVNSQFYKTSDLLRSNVATANQVLKEGRVQIPSGIKVIRLYRSQGGKGSMSALNNSSYQLPPTPAMSVTPNRRRINPMEARDASPDSAKIATPGSITKWRKCLTPVRTYSRRAIPVQRQSSASSIKKLRNALRLVPSSTSNATQGIKGTQKVEVRKRKLLIDPKVTISPTSFKQQQQKHRSTPRKSPSRHAHRSSKNFDNKASAFDMLTRSNRARNLSTKLDQQFKKNCVNKATSTCPKYKILCTIPSPSSKKSKTAIQQRPLSPVSAITAAAMMDKVVQRTTNSNNNSSVTTVAPPQPRNNWT